jgi:hypothetical protein
LLLLGALVAGARAVVRHPSWGVSPFALIAGAVFMFVAGMFSGNYYDSRFFWLLFGLAIIEVRRTGHESPSPEPERTRP